MIPEKPALVSPLLLSVCQYCPKDLQQRFNDGKNSRFSIIHQCALIFLNLLCYKEFYTNRNRNLEGMKGIKLSFKNKRRVQAQDIKLSFGERISPGGVLGQSGNNLKTQTFKTKERGQQGLLVISKKLKLFSRLDLAFSFVTWASAATI